MIRPILIILSFFVSLNLYSQSITQIKSDSQYLWGEGEGESVRLADENALIDLISQIATHVSGETNTLVSNIQDGQNARSVVRFEQVMKTYTSATLTNTLRMVIQEEPRAQVFRYIKKSDLDKIFSSRIEKIKEMVSVASNAESQGLIGDAIRYYYWANMLHSSLRPLDDVKLNLGSGDISADILIPQRLNEIFSNLTAEIIGKQANSNCYEVRFTYKGNPVANIGYTYWQGNDWSCVNTANDGVGLVELMPGFNPDKLKIKYECLHLEESQCDREVNQVLESVREINYPNANISINMSNKSLSSKVSLMSQDNSISKEKQETKKHTNTNSNTKKIDEKPISKDNINIYQNVVSKIISAISKKNFLSVEQFFTPYGYDIFNKLIKYGNAQIVGQDLSLEFTSLNGDVVCRSIPMRFSFSRNRKFMENVVFVFDESKRIDNISFGLSNVAKNDIFGNLNISWDKEVKEVLISFLENYKTAYALKRLDYIESIFAEDALIISGKVLVKYAGSRELGFSQNRYVKQTRHTKKEYINRLKNIFRYNEFINIKFANNEVKKMGKGENIYAIQIKQDYFSSNYGDTGYLFLLVDVSNPQTPIIHVRSWQEYPDPSWGVLGPEHF